MSLPTALALALALGLVGPRAGQAQESSADLSFGGRLFRRIAARSDTVQAYALLLPPGYDAKGKYPLLVILDPRGRALVPLAKFGPPAAARGFVVMSSYNSQSDGPVQPNIDAMNAMLDDAFRALAVDQHRVYLAGFSGTARLAWPIAAEIPTVIRGIIALCAGPTAPAGAWTARFRNTSTFEVFAATGRIDFNRDEVVTLDRRMLADRIPHRTVVFDGGHEWGPPAIAEEAIEWIVLRERLANPADPAGRDSATAAWRDRRLRDLDSVLAIGDSVEVIRRFRSLERDLGDDQGVDRYRATHGELLRREKSLFDAEAKRIDADRAWTVKGDGVLGHLGPADRDPGPIAAAVGLDRLLVERESTDPTTRDSARRRLEWLAVNTAFYGPRSYAERKAWDQVVVLLEMARRIRPLSPDACAADRRAREAGGGAGRAAFPECA